MADCDDEGCEDVPNEDEKEMPRGINQKLIKK
jgi:hypothetical protein